MICRIFLQVVGRDKVRMIIITNIIFIITVITVIIKITIYISLLSSSSSSIITITVITIIIIIIIITIIFHHHHHCHYRWLHRVTSRTCTHSNAGIFMRYWVLNIDIMWLLIWYKCRISLYLLCRSYSGLNGLKGLMVSSI